MHIASYPEYVGQKHILGEGKLLSRAIEADKISSLILYGPPGIGKTTLAHCAEVRQAGDLVHRGIALDHLDHALLIEG